MSEVINFFETGEIIGEITVLVKGINNKQYNDVDISKLKIELNELINAGLSLSAASKYLAKKNGIKKGVLYNLN